MVMECLTYDRARAYGEELPRAAYETWQPRKVMEQLLAIDPYADKDRSMAFGLEPAPGEPPEVMRSLGTERVLGMAMLKKHYDALGSYLHMPTVKQAETGGVDHRRMRERCEQTVAFVEEVFRSRFFNSTIGTFCEIDCMRCGKPIRRRLPHDGIEEVHAQCPECGCTYTVTLTEAGGPWRAHQQEVPCGGERCDRHAVLWADEVKVGTWWTCTGCSTRNSIELSVVSEEGGTEPVDGMSKIDR